MREKLRHDIQVPLKRCLMQWSASILSRDVNICTFLDQDSGSIGIPPYGDYVKHGLTKPAASGVDGIKRNACKLGQVCSLDLLDDSGQLGAHNYHELGDRELPSASVQRYS